jgi:hypothetical protein
MKKFLLVLLSIGLFSSCSSKSEPNRTNQRHFFDGFFGRAAYQKMFERQTKRERLSSNFDMTAIADVTYWSSSLSEKYVSALMEDYLLNEQQSAHLKREQEKDVAQFETFIVSLTTRKTSWSDLGSGNSLWNVHLQAPGKAERVLTHSIQKIDANDDKAKQYFKSMNRFSETYRVRFKKNDVPADATQLSFFLSGPLGVIEMFFDRSDSGR